MHPMDGWAKRCRGGLCAFESAFFAHRPDENDFVVELRRFHFRDCEQECCVASAVVDGTRCESHVAKSRRTLETTERTSNANAGSDELRRVATEPRGHGRRLALDRTVACDEDTAHRSLS